MAYCIFGPTAFEIAARIAITHRDRETISALLSLGFDPRSAYHPDLVTQGCSSALEQAIAEEWDEGVLLMIRLN